MATRTAQHVEGHNQNKYRGYVIFYDQHKNPNVKDALGNAVFANGRPWGGVVERSANGAAMPMPVGELQPVGWPHKAPWLPPMKYINASIGKIAPEGMQWLPGTGNSNRFRIDYGRMIAEYEEAHKIYYAEMVEKHATLLPGARVPDFGDAVPYQVRLAIGQPPKSPKLPQAAMANNPWMLGFTNTVDEALVGLVKDLGYDVQKVGPKVETGDSERVAQLQTDLDEMRKLLLQSLVKPTSEEKPKKAKADKATTE